MKRKIKILDNNKKLAFKKLRKIKFTWKGFGLAVLYVFIAIVFVIVLMFAWFAKDLPTPSKIAGMKPTESTKLYDRTGKTLLYETGEQKRTIVASDQISDNLKMATVATEDANFYSHHGFNVKSYAEAIFEKLTGRTAVLRGGSTITQQYVKNALLTSDRSFIRKAKELILAIELESMYNKDQILTMYLNEIPYGNSTAGAEASSQMYFGKSAKDLTLAEAATLAAIPKAPTYYSPYGTHTKELSDRRDYVLDRMVETKKISKAQADDAKKVDTLALGGELKPRKDAIAAPHFAMYVLEQVADQYGEDVIQKQGLKIITSLDLDKQKAAEAAVAAGVKKLTQNNASNAALASVDPKTGEILAMVGSEDYFNTQIDGNVNVADSLRQPGSSWKPIVYATLFKKADYSPSKTLFDLQTDFGGYIPKNFSGRFVGPIDIRHALGNSLNIPAVKAASLAGIDNIIRTAQDLGITSLGSSNKYGLSFGLGVAEVKPVEMAEAYSVFANGGVKHDLKSVIKITDSNNKTIYEYDQSQDKGHQVIDSQIAYEIASMMSDNSARTMTFGTHSALYFSDRTVAAKTGTTSDNKDGWTVGFTPSLATVVWTGNNTPSPMKNDAVVLAGPIFHSYMAAALTNKPDEPFVKPDGIQTVTVERYSNKLPSEASKEFTTDIFASWQVPTEKDNVNVKVRLCAGTNKLAPANFPDSMVQEATFTNLHSERPDNPNWENPVRGWAESAGMANLPPKETCSASEMNSSISFSSPTDGATVTGETAIKVTLNSAAKINSVEYFVDNLSVAKPTEEPFSANFDFSTLADGSHKVSAVASDENGATLRSDINVIVAREAGALSISNIKTTISGNKATITWITSAPASSQVLYRKTTDENYTVSSTDPTETTAHSVTIDIIKNQTYKYRVVSQDEQGNTVTSQEASFSN